MSQNLKITLSGSYHLSPLKTGDEENIVYHLENPRVSKWLIQSPSAHTIKTASVWIEDNRQFYQSNLNHLNLAIRDQKQNLIGAIGKKLSTGSSYAHSCEIGYWVAEPYMNKGIATVAVKHYTDYLIEKEHFIRVTAVSSVANVASSRVLEKCSFKLEGILNKFAVLNGAYTDCKLYAIVK